MSFRFRLQKVLDHRQRLVDEQSGKVGEAAAHVAQARGQVASVEGQMTSLLQQGPDGSSFTLQVSDLHQRRLWLDHLGRRRGKLLLRVESAEQELAAQRAELTRLWRDLEVIKKLREKQKEEWAAEIRRRENQDLDEIGQIRADRRQRENLALLEAEDAGVQEFQPGAK